MQNRKVKCYKMPMYRSKTTSEPTTKNQNTTDKGTFLVYNFAKTKLLKNAFCKIFLPLTPQHTTKALAHFAHYCAYLQPSL